VTVATRLASTGTERDELVREAATMVLYVSVVEIAELAALPETHRLGRVTGPVGTALVAIIWGTAIGLAVAHWFAFGFAARELRGGVRRIDFQVGLAQLGAAAFVAAVSCLPIVLFGDVREQEFIGVMPAILIGVSSYFIGRTSGRSRLAAAIYGAIALLAGLAVAAIKGALAAH
jgi:hypothetical protein